jgi:hypothetical protein
MKLMWLSTNFDNQVIKIHRLQKWKQAKHPQPLTGISGEKSMFQYTDQQLRGNLCKYYKTV